MRQAKRDAVFGRLRRRVFRRWPIGLLRLRYFFAGYRSCNRNYRADTTKRLLYPMHESLSA